MASRDPLEILARRLAQRQSQGLLRRLVGVGPACGPHVVVGGKPCLLMASNDYLGLAGHPRLAQAAQAACLASGTGSGASRLVSGNLEAHQVLEKQIAAFKETEAALFFPTGYMANLGAVSGLAGPGDLIISDQLNHASLIDACRLSRATVKVYAHGDVEAVRRLLADAPPQGLTLVVSDGVFSMDGDLAPVPELLAAARQAGALLLIDDAHATGVWGARGRGSIEHFGLTPSPDMVMVGTFSKALGGLGGFVAGHSLVVQTMVNNARSFIYTTAPPPSQAAAAGEGLRLVDEEPWRRGKLHQLCAYFRKRLDQAGFSLGSLAGPIIPLLVGPADKAMTMGLALQERGVLAPAIRPPTVPEGTSRIRLTVTAAHSEEDLDQAVLALVMAAQEAGL